MLKRILNYFFPHPFDRWLAGRKYNTFKQYGNYVEGWRQSMPWAYKGMSIAYDRWAEKHWNGVCCDAECLRKVWEKAMVLGIISRAETVEEIATGLLNGERRNAT